MKTLIGRQQRVAALSSLWIVERVGDRGRWTGRCSVVIRYASPGSERGWQDSGGG